MQQIAQQAVKVKIPDNIHQILLAIWNEHAEAFKEDADEQLSDRRFVKVSHLLRISAATNKRMVVDLSDVMLLKDCLWNNDINRYTIFNIVRDVINRHDVLVPLAERRNTNNLFKLKNQTIYY